MSEIPSVILAFLAGGALGAFFFCGLWWTIRRGVSSRQPALWFSGSLLLRMAILLMGFYFLARGEWHRMLASMTGFLLARIGVSRMIPVGVQLRKGPS